MKTIKYLGIFLLFSILTLKAAAQDAVIISDGILLGEQCRVQTSKQ